MRCSSLPHRRCEQRIFCALVSLTGRRELNTAVPAGEQQPGIRRRIRQSAGTVFWIAEGFGAGASG